MSKIYDALRKAELGKGKFKGKKLRKKPLSGGPRAKLLFSGVDDELRRAMLHLKNSIDSTIKEKASKVVMFTSSSQGEGKTTITASIARVIALGETDRVLLVDCAVQRPQLHNLFGIENEKGILEFLSEGLKLEEVVRSVDAGVLDIIPTGRVRDTEIMQPLFASDRMEAFVKEASENYDYVFIDTSSAISAPETPIIGSFVDGIILVIHSGKTKREVIKRAIMLLEKLGGKVIGTVLNRKKYYIPEFIYKRV